MKIFKFGGASVKDASGFRNVVRIVQDFGDSEKIIVVSAMGKTTNALEDVIHAYFNNEDYGITLAKLQKQQNTIITELFGETGHIHEALALYHNDLASFLRRNKSPNYNYVYDQVVCYGELISSFILHNALEQAGVESQLLDARDYIKTDSTYREGKVNWDITQNNINILKKDTLYVTQGFIASDANHFTTTLGREGSDYTAAIFAYATQANSVTIWKDVPGVLNADPRYFESPELLNQISYTEAIELAYYGASVIHPKTLQPLQRKEIPLFVRSFVNPTEHGTRICKGKMLEPELPCFIVKHKQQLIRISSKDFSFASESMLHELFGTLNDLKIKVNLMQTSAMAVTLVLEDKYNHIHKLNEKLELHYNVKQEKNVNLFTLRHYTQEADEIITRDKKTLLRQVSGRTLQVVTV